MNTFEASPCPPTPSVFNAVAKAAINSTELTIRVVRAGKIIERALLLKAEKKNDKGIYIYAYMSRNLQWLKQFTLRID